MGEQDYAVAWKLPGKPEKTKAFLTEAEAGKLLQDIDHWSHEFEVRFEQPPTIFRKVGP